MNKFLILIFIIQIISCTDQDNIKSYSLNNSTDYNIKAILFDRFGKSDTTNINKNDFKIMYEEGPPYDDGPFGVFDSLKIIFEDYQISDMIIDLPCLPSVGDSIEFPFESIKYTNGDTFYGWKFTVVSVTYQMKISKNNQPFEHDIIEVFVR